MRSRPGLHWLVPVVVPILALAQAGPASTGPPTQVRITEQLVEDLPAGEDFCPDPVRIAWDLDFKKISFAEPIGQGIWALTVGSIKAVVTNMKTGTSVSLDVSGPAFLDTTVDPPRPVFGTGHTLLFTEEGLLYASGRLTRDAAGELHLNGQTRDVCAMLVAA
ncbi:MAG TPA: hypothetical protein VK962_07880 [Actinomycetota bacterium]|nr:hypothetical protein [Actinomycetota bacterium]